MAITPITRKENFLARAAGENGLELEPVTREEYYLNKIAEGGGGGGGSVTVDTALSPTSTNPVQNKAVYAAFANAADIVDGKQDKPIEETVSEAAASITPVANTIYNCGELTSLTISSPPATGAYSIVFTSGSTATTTTIPATILGLEDFAAEANTIYEINVLDNRAVIGSWAVTSNG
jgi:hypothetical protein